MTKGRIFFLILVAAATLSALVLLVYAHMDMTQMRTVRPAFNFDGIIALVCGITIAAGFAVLFPIWRLFAYDPDLAHKDLTRWIWALLALVLGLHLPFAISFSIDGWINAKADQTPWDALKSVWAGSDGLFLLLLLLWPVPAIYGLLRYRMKFAPAGNKAP